MARDLRWTTLYQAKSLMRNKSWRSDANSFLLAPSPSILHRAGKVMMKMSELFFARTDGTMSAQLIHKGKNFWLIRIYKDRDPITGNKRFKTIRFVGDRRGAREELDNLLQRESRALTDEPTNLTVNELFELWFELVGENRYRENTVRGFKGNVAFDVQPCMGELKLIDVRQTHLKAMFKAMGDRGVGRNKIYLLYALVAKVFDRAVAWGFLEENPVSRVPVPRCEKNQITPMTSGELRDFIAVTDRGRHSEFFRTAVITAMRPGEINALRWPDIDFQGCLITVQRSLVWRGHPKDGWYLVSPKTERGRRQIEIPRSLSNSLLKLKGRQESRIRKLGDRYTDDGFVFANRLGRPYFRRSYIRMFKESLILAGLSKTVRFYDLRHTSATLLLQAGVNIKVVSERLGHPSRTPTPENAIYVLPDRPRGTGERIETLLEGDLEDTDTP